MTGMDILLSWYFNMDAEVTMRTEKTRMHCHALLYIIQRTRIVSTSESSHGRVE